MTPNAGAEHPQNEGPGRKRPNVPVSLPPCKRRTLLARHERPPAAPATQAPGTRERSTIRPRRRVERRSAHPGKGRRPRGRLPALRSSSRRSVLLEAPRHEGLAPPRAHPRAHRPGALGNRPRRPRAAPHIEPRESPVAAARPERSRTRPSRSAPKRDRPAAKPQGRMEGRAALCPASDARARATPARALHPPSGGWVGAVARRPLRDRRTPAPGSTGRASSRTSTRGPPRGRAKHHPALTPSAIARN